MFSYNTLLVNILGFFHEHQRRDRNDYINVIYDIIANYHGVSDNFDICQNCSNQTLPYDLDSLMHYTNTASGRWDKDGKQMTTIEVKANPEIELLHEREKDTFSPLDLQDILDLYDCHGKNTLKIEE